MSTVGGVREPLRRLAREGGGGATGSAISATVMLAWESLWAGRWGEAEALVAEGVELCDAQGSGCFVVGPILAGAPAAGRGDDDGCVPRMR